VVKKIQVFASSSVSQRQTTEGRNHREKKKRREKNLSLSVIMQGRHLQQEKK